MKKLIPFLLLLACVTASAAPQDTPWTRATNSAVARTALGAAGLTNNNTFSGTNTFLNLSAGTLSIGELVLTNTATFSTSVIILGNLTATGATFSGAVTNNFSSARGNYYSGIPGDLWSFGLDAVSTGGFVLYRNGNRHFLIDSSARMVIGGTGYNIGDYPGDIDLIGSVYGNSTITAAAGMKMGDGGTLVTNILSATATLDFGNILAAASADLTITVTGAKANDSVALGLPTAPDASIVYNAFVSAANTVTVRAFNVGAIADDPASATYRVTLHQF